MPTIIDQSLRERALDPTQSFIVQAPAGSGKTELLVRRFLVLLANAVRSPEEILAITFTRKAAAEMQQRILDTLELATLPPPTEPYSLQTWHLAKAVLEKDQKNQWQILANPQRLRIQTIDAFCAYLTHRMPILSGLGPATNTLTQPEPYHQQAIRKFLTLLEHENVHSQALSKLLLHLDNRADKLEQLFIDLLLRRDQWLPHLISHTHQLSPTEFRYKLEQGLTHVGTELLESCYRNFPWLHAEEFITLFNYAQEQLLTGLSLDKIPKPTVANLPIWQTIADFLLTQKHQWRAAVNVKNGFPPKEKPMKTRMEALLTLLPSHELFRTHLSNINTCPPPTYNENQWQILSALTTLLPLLVAELNLLFTQYGVADFCEVALAALRALEEQDSPTELACILDQQISHILVDEFQDTSTTQFKLLTQLTLGWQENEGKTLFLVGDPMQSIYRFRQAEVGLFLKAQQEGIGDIFLTPLVLQTNFRSTPTIVDWVNTHFTQIFPSQINMSLGAIPYSPSVAMPAMPVDPTTHISLYPIFNEDPQAMAQRVCELIKQLMAENPQQSIAVLVRSRSHLATILPALKQAHLSFNAVEIEALGQQLITHQLLALTCALLHLGDRLAWLSVLRAPWCGLTLSDLHAIAGHDHTATIWQLLETMDFQSSDLSEEGKIRLAHIIPILADSLAQKAKIPLRPWIESTWKSLGGEFCITNPQDFSSAKAYFDLLEQFDISNENTSPDVASLTKQIMENYTSPQTDSHCQLSIMTIHKAKGLEFDAVIIPHLERKNPQDGHTLLAWLDRPQPNGENDLILAPIKAKQEITEPIYEYLRALEKTKSNFELARLLYVAVTRAKRSLHLLAHISQKEAQLVKPDSNTLLYLLWPVFERTTNEPDSDKKTGEPLSCVTKQPLKLERFRIDSLGPLSKSFIAAPSLPTAWQGRHVIDTWQNQTDQAVQAQLGTVIHRCLQLIAQEGIQKWPLERLPKQQSQWRTWLLQTGILPQQISNCLTDIEQALTLTLSDPRGRWILSSHLDARCEFAVTTQLHGQLLQFVMDRTFVDENNVRWIIDYKTSMLGNPNQTLFLEQAKQLHNQQLQNYALVMQQLDDRPIHLGLYFPLFSGWVEWDF